MCLCSRSMAAYFSLIFSLTDFCSGPKYLSSACRSSSALCCSVSRLCQGEHHLLHHIAVNVAQLRRSHERADALDLILQGFVDEDLHVAFFLFVKKYLRKGGKGHAAFRQGLQLASALMSRRKAFASFSVFKNRVFCLPRPSVAVARHGDFLSST